MLGLPLRSVTQSRRGYGFGVRRPISLLADSPAFSNDTYFLAPKQSRVFEN